MNTHQSCRPLPPLAGICSLAEAAKPGLSVEECVRRLKRFHYAVKVQAATALNSIPLVRSRISRYSRPHIAGAVAAITEDDPGAESETTSDNTPG